MKSITQFLLAPALALGLTATAMAQTASPYDAKLTLSPATGTLTTVGGSLTYNINISQLQYSTATGYGAPNDPQALAGYDLFIDYNPADLSVTSATINSTPMNVGGQGDSPSTGSNGSGQFELTDFSNDLNPSDFSSQATSFTIGTITFSSLAAATSAISFDATSSLSDQNGYSIVYGATGSSVTASAVPEPSTIGLLLLAGVILAGGAIRRRQSA